MMQAFQSFVLFGLSSLTAAVNSVVTHKIPVSDARLVQETPAKQQQPASVLKEVEYVVCLEGGSTRTWLQVLDTTGQPLVLYRGERQTTQVETGGSNINLVRMEGLNRVFQGLFADLQVGACRKGLKELAPNAVLIVGLPGMDDPSNREQAMVLFSAWGFRPERVKLISDEKLALEAAGPNTSILLAGTGTVCLAQEDGKVSRVGGMGPVLGDLGSGHQIGLKAVQAALAAEGGWGASTTLVQTLKQEFQPELQKLGAEKLSALRAQINNGEIGYSRLASLAPIVFREGSQGDSISQSIINDAAHQLGSLLAQSLQDIHADQHRVILSGGLFRNEKANEFIREMTRDPELQQRSRSINLNLVNAAGENLASLVARGLVSGTVAWDGQKTNAESPRQDNPQPEDPETEDLKTKDSDISQPQPVSNPA